MSVTKKQTQKFKHVKQIDNNCHYRDFVQECSCVENGGLKLV